MGQDVRSANRKEPAARGEGMRIAIVCGRFNDHITDRLLEGAVPALTERGVAPGDITLVWVPGSYEIPFAARQLALTGDFHAIITLGAVIKGETGHYDFVAGECAQFIQQAQFETSVPIIFGVLTTNTLDQALARSDTANDNRGVDSAVAALEMAAFVQGLADTSR
jgi:6,7-dimethyl-8-ribityllumazine synthase